MSEAVASDSTFYIAFLSEEEINEPKVLYKIISNLNFYAGRIIKKEISKHLVKHKWLSQNIKFLCDYNFLSLLQPIIYKIKDNKREKGEYEAIGIALFLFNKGTLKYLVLDDSHAHDIVNKYFPKLAKKKAWSTKFLVLLHCKEKILKKEEVRDILMKIYELAGDKTKKKKPFHITEKNRDEIILPLMEEIERC